MADESKNEQLTAQQEDSKGTKKKPKKEKKPRKKRSKKWIVWLLVLLILAGAVYFLFLRPRENLSDAVSSLYTYAQAERRDITEILTDSGTLQPADSYTVSALVSGEILSADFEEGDVVSKGDILYEIDSSDTASSIERAENSLAQSRRSYDKKVASQADLTITAPISGTITGLTSKVGDSVNSNMTVATIENTDTLLITEYYSNAYAGQIYVGMSANISVPAQMQNLTGWVQSLSGATQTSGTGMECFAVTVAVTNPGSLNVGDAATCYLDGGLYPSISDEDGLSPAEKQTVYAETSGKVSGVYAENNSRVYAGQTLIQLTSETISDEITSAADSLRDAELSLQSQYDTLEDYTITAPIDGTIIDKYYKVGEKNDAGKSLCTIYDLSYLTLTLNISELDISRISVGQTASITAEAVDDREYSGVVTRVGVNGTTSGGITTYPVDIRIDETDGLLPGMNVDVSLVVEEQKGVVTIPTAAVEQSGRVLVKTADGSTGDGAPEGYQYVYVKMGAADEDYVEIVEGVSEGDTVAYIPDTASGTSGFGAFAAGGGEFPAGGGGGGGFPAGGGF